MGKHTCGLVTHYLIARLSKLTKLSCLIDGESITRLGFGLCLCLNTN